MSRIRAALLDMGGVLLEMGGSQGFPDGNLDWRGRQALFRLLRDDGRRLKLDDLERWVFEPWREGYDRRYETGVEEPWRPHMRRLRHHTRSRRWDRTLLRAWFRPYGESLRPCPGVPEALVRLRRQGLRLALVSNVPLPGRLYLEVLEAWDLRRFFQSFQFSYDTGHRKPSPAMLRQALQEIGVGPGRAIMVGDRRSSDVLAGKLAGTRTVWVRSEHHEGPKADHAIASLAGLPKLVDRLSAGDR